MHAARMVQKMIAVNWLKKVFQTKPTKISHEMKLKWNLPWLNTRAVHNRQLFWVLGRNFTASLILLKIWHSRNQIDWSRLDHGTRSVKNFMTEQR